ncbi:MULTISPECIES: RNA 2',3'-cyclic phosphodiesterase [Bacillaceae]|uniref:RNA 2',3'-cyclic phosphodiesterase n=1 Tax=Evansella alkalicola TaxID=745819 RepID=A0ABS6JR85_9BACI|nr:MULTISPECIES: RNA 2',3'-cyclic phosphodiesterase [Bacillaceae]MBU9721069.1 RNA 2',3'-cyclic phosphodiesterase [Bacillus alkalicola]
MTEQRHHFIGLKIPKHIQPILKGVQEELNVNKYYKKVTYPDDFHITLLFLGGWDKQKVDQLWANLKSNVSNDAFELTLSRIGYFGAEKSPRVLWFGVEESKGLTELKNNVSEQAEKLNFPVEKRPFRPHITLAKNYKSQAPIDFRQYKLVEKNWPVLELTLFEINPGKKPMYKSVSIIPFSR